MERSPYIRENLEDFFGFLTRIDFIGRLFDVSYITWHKVRLTKPIVLVKPFREHFFFENAAGVIFELHGETERFGEASQSPFHFEYPLFIYPKSRDII